MKNKLFILLLAFVLLLSACSNNSPPDDNTKEVLPELESAGSIESRGEKFIENFPQDYPSFELLEYVFGSAENAPIQPPMTVKAICTFAQTMSMEKFLIINSSVFVFQKPPFRAAPESVQRDLRRFG